MKKLSIIGLLSAGLLLSSCFGTTPTSPAAGATPPPPSLKVGELKKGAYANFLVTDGPIFEKGTLIHENWVQGRQYITKAAPKNIIDGQYVVAVLRDKFSGNIEQNAIIEDNKIIELSQEDKLFRF